MTNAVILLAHVYPCPGSCYYAGDADGGRSGSSDDYDSVIEGKYTEYQVVGLFGHKFKYTQFRQDLCTTDI